MKILQTTNRLIAGAVARMGGFIPDDLYLRLRFRLIMGQKLNLETGYTSIAPQKIQNSLDLLK